MPHLSTFMMEIKHTWIRKFIHKDSKILTESTGCNVTKFFSLDQNSYHILAKQYIFWKDLLADYTIQ